MAAVQTAMNLEEKQTIHPFFSKPHENNAPTEEPVIEAPADTAHGDPDYEQHEKAQKGQKKRGRKPGSTNKKKESPTGKSQALMERFTVSSRGQAAAGGDTTVIAEEPALEEDPNQDRRKRRKTQSPPPAQNESAAATNASLDWHQQLELEAATAMTPQTRRNTSGSHDDKVSGTTVEAESLNDNRPATPPNGTDIESVSASKGSASTITTGKTTPKRKIKVSKNGKLLSSPPPKAEPEAIPPKKRRGRKPKLQVVPTVTIIKYGQNAASRRAFGEKIGAILRGEKPVPRPVTPKKAPPKPAGPPKPTHPFFLGKPAPKGDENTASKQATESRPIPSPKAMKKSAVTPGKLKLESRSFNSSGDMPTFGVKSSRASKQSGLVEAQWPAQGFSHVRNLEYDIPPLHLPMTEERSLKTRKLKNNVLTVSDEENLMSTLASQLRSSIQSHLTPALSEFVPPQDVRLPTRLLTTGASIQEQVRAQVPSLYSHENSSTTNSHPAVSAIFADIETTLTPFDLSKCEPLAWAQKYAPKYASHVLQPGKESTVLKDWLQSLTVLAVSGKHASKAVQALDSKKPPKKKRKKTHDDFIVDSDEEGEEELIGFGNSSPVSIRRARWTRNKNVVVISGPHGCGKTAMVYAVAKDLDFEIFEINSGSRRSGKDIQDKVGDMTANHLVSHKREDMMIHPESAPVEDADTERHSDALQKDLDSGRQGTMMSFFKSKAPAKDQPTAKPKTVEPRKATSSGQATLPIAQSQRKSQKQSLILFEEADVLYEEDQGFWAQVTKLASQSKRPIIITCTNEALIPVHELPAAAILRISPPPVSLATDYMVVLAGHEGHILERDAVSTLYRSKNCDLRASITELNLWCQMSVGDRKGGLEWVYQRWPPGKDVDEDGRLLRVASKGTYALGMGCLSHNMFASKDNVGLDCAEELLKESWEEWGINPQNWSQHTESAPGAPRSTVDELKRLDAMANSMSAVDTYCSIDMPSYEHYFDQPTDPSLPRLPDKTRLSYTLAAPVLQVDHVTDFNHFDTDMFTQTHILIHRVYGGRQSTDAEESMTIPSTEQGFTAAILQHKNHQVRTSSETLSRPDFSRAFDILAYPPDTLPALNTSYNLTASSFDRTFSIIVQDLAPYVRSIVASELVLETQRLRLGNLLSEGGSGGRSGKRQRTTRAARTALEGGSRDTKRRERWFDRDLNRVLVMATAGKSWTGMGSSVEAESEGKSEGSRSLPGTQEE